MSQRFYPRNDRARQDAIAGHRFHAPDNAQSRAAGLATDPIAFNSLGCLRVNSSARVYEGVIAASGWTLGVSISNDAETWNTDATGVASECAAGVSSLGLAMDVASIARTSAKLVTFGIGPDATVVAATETDLTLTVARSGFTHRTNASEAARLITVEPFSMSYTGPSSIGTALITGTTGIVASLVFTLNNSAETFAGLAAATVASLFAGIPIAQSSVFYSANNKTLTVTVVGSDTVTGNKFKPSFPANTTFTLRKAAFATNTLCVIA